jgi:hypothetical protein
LHSIFCLECVAQHLDRLAIEHLLQRHKPPFEFLVYHFLCVCEVSFHLQDAEKPRKLQRGEISLSAIIASQSSGGDGDAKVSKAISALRKTCANE